LSSAAPTGGKLAGLLGVDWPGGGDVDRHALVVRRPRIELGPLEREELAVVAHDLAAEQFVDDLDRLEHHRAADRDLRPHRRDDVLVERLTGTQTEVEATRVHRAERGRGMRDDRRVVAKTGARDRRAEPQ
jgi:hypothetical protein